MNAKKSESTPMAPESKESENSENHFNCLETAYNLTIDRTKAHDLVDKTGKPFILIAKNLKKKFPILEALPDTFPLFRLRKHHNINNVYECDTLRIFKDDEGNVHAYDCELQPVDCEFIRWKSANGFAEIKINGQTLIIGISASDEHRLSCIEYADEFDHNNPFEDEHGNSFDGTSFVGKEKPPNAYLMLVPRPEIPLYSDDLQLKKTYEIIGNGKKSRQHNTPLFDIKTEEGTIIKNVISNAPLLRLYEKYGNGCKFQISQRFQKLDKDGNTIKASNKSKDIWEVRIKDLSLDLSDIDI